MIKKKLTGPQLIPEANGMAFTSLEMSDIKIPLIRINFISDNPFSRNQ